MRQSQMSLPSRLPELPSMSAHVGEEPGGEAGAKPRSERRTGTRKRKGKGKGVLGSHTQREPDRARKREREGERG